MLIKIESIRCPDVTGLVSGCLRNCRPDTPEYALSGACNNFVSPEIECCIRIGSSQRCDLFTTCPTVAISQTILFSVYAHKKPIPEPWSIYFYNTRFHYFDSFSPCYFSHMILLLIYLFIS